MICKNYIYGDGNEISKGQCGHKFCKSCKNHSMPKRTSDFWVCCRAKCHGLNPYDAAERRRVLKAKRVLETRNDWLSPDEWIYWG